MSTNDPCNLQIGSTVWYYYREARRYEPGSSVNVITEREKFQPRNITGETKVSWVVDGVDLIPKNPAKRVRVVGDKSPSPDWHRCYALSEQAIADHIWDKENRHRIVQAIDYRWSVNSATLRKIDALIRSERDGYDVEVVEVA